MQNNKPSRRENHSKDKIVSQKDSSSWEKFGNGSSAEIENMTHYLKGKRRLLKKSRSPAENAAELVANLIKSTHPMDKENIDHILKQTRQILEAIH